MILTALAVDNIEVILSFVGSIIATAISFLFPGLAYLVAVAIHGKSSIRKQWDTWCYLALSFLFLLCFTTIVALFIYMSVTLKPGETPTTSL